MLTHTPGLSPAGEIPLRIAEETDIEASQDPCHRA
ncbi:hypothetical protein ACVWZI_002628 [Thermostichus sp. OS-CIW-28]